MPTGRAEFLTQHHPKLRRYRRTRVRVDARMCAIAVYVRIRARISSDTDSDTRMLSVRRFSLHNSPPHGLRPDYSPFRIFSRAPSQSWHHVCSPLDPQLTAPYLPSPQPRQAEYREGPYQALGRKCLCAQTHNSVFRWRMGPSSRPWRLAVCSKCCTDTSPFRPRMPLASGDERVPPLPIDSSADRAGARTTAVV